MLPVSGSYHQVLTDTALGYLALGWSVIPLNGDTRPDQAKVAAVEWSPYQLRRAREAEVAAWAASKRFGAVGIVTGAVSQLAVLDFDEPALLQAFERACPELIATRIILTRRGKHLYFHVPPQLIIRSRKLDGIDLLAGGRYAVAPPSVIDGHTYAVRRGGRPRTLTQRDLDQLNRFLDALTEKPLQTPAARFYGPLAPSTPEAPVKAQEQAAAPDPLASCESSTPLNTSLHPIARLDDLIHLYRGLASRSGRNAALFQVSCLARDQGWSFAMTVETFADLHVDQPARRQQRQESPSARYREALNTMRSVYTRPARRLTSADSHGLYNSIRERLFQLGQTCVVRVLEGLHLAGFIAGQLVTERDVVEALRGIVGRRSIQAALKAFSPQNRPFFKKNPPRYPSRRSAATPLRIVNTTNAVVGRSKRVRTCGRPSTTFRIPSPERLCKLLGVQPSGSDPLTLEDLHSARQTRLAAHRELIRRRPGTYLRQWLGDRLGVSGPTIWRYSHAIDGLQVTSTFTATAIGWWNLKNVPASLGDTSGTCLEDETGKRWPALKAIAAKLLRQGRAVRLLVQSLSYYAFDMGRPNGLGREVVEPRCPSNEPALMTFGQRVERFARTLRVHDAPEPAATPNPDRQPKTAPVPRVESLPEPKHPPKRPTRPRHYRHPLRDPAAEALAAQVYERINRLTIVRDQRISLATARRWVDQTGEDAIHEALQLLNRRAQVVKPAGWFATLLRSSNPSG